MTLNNENGRPGAGAKRDEAPQSSGCLGPLARMTRDHARRTASGRTPAHQDGLTSLPKSSQVEDVAANQKRRVSDKDVSHLGLLGSYIVKTTAEYVSVIPTHLAGDISGGYSS